MPSVSELPSGQETQHQHEEVLTLAEAAAYLRVPEAALEKLVEDRDIPAQKIGGEWRFLKRALALWLSVGPRYREVQRYFPIMLEHPMLDELAGILAHRLRMELKAVAQPSAPRPGSKEAVRQHFGIWKDDPTAEAMLAEI